MSKYVYIATTALFCLSMTGAGVMDASAGPEVVAGMQHLGFPLWFAVQLGVAKLLGVATLAAPGLPRLKEWAYAGFTINLVSATIAHAVTGDPVGNVITPVVIWALMMASWATRPENRRLGAILPA